MVGSSNPASSIVQICCCAIGQDTYDLEQFCVFGGGRSLFEQISGLASDSLPPTGLL